MRFEHEAAPVRVHERMALTSVDLLSSIVTAWPAGLSGLGALAVDDCRRGVGVAPDPFAICHHERVVYPFKAPVVAPGGKPAVNRPPRRQVVMRVDPVIPCRETHCGDRGERGLTTDPDGEVKRRDFLRGPDGKIAWLRDGGRPFAKQG